jgi:hypothetical protein
MIFFPPCRIALALLSLLLLAGCGARHLQQAQDRFNAAASDETRMSPTGDLSYTSPAGLNVYAPALSNYKIALSLLDKELKDNKAELDSDKLTGVAVALRCMTLWRISDLDPPGLSKTVTVKDVKDCALGAQADAQAGKFTLGTRDRLLLAALPAFIDADQARLQTNYPDKSKGFRDSYVVVDDVIKSEPSDHDVKFYLHLVQVRTLRSWRNAALRVPNDSPLKAAAKSDAAEARAKAESEVCALAPDLDPLSPRRSFVAKEFQQMAVTPDTANCGG